MSLFKVDEKINVLYLGLWQNAIVLEVKKEIFTVKLVNSKIVKDPITIKIG
jgi:hypothetical protein